MKKVDNYTGTRFHGFLIDLLELIKIELKDQNFNYEIIEDSTGLYGSTTDDEWSGLVGELESGEV